jgi:hypothetical protein
MKQQTFGATVRYYLQNYETQIIEIEKLSIYPYLSAVGYIVACVTILVMLGIPHNQLEIGRAHV